MDTITEESAASRARTRQQEEEQTIAAEAKGVEFIDLTEADRQHLIEQSAPVYQAWGEKIGVEYLQKVQQRLGN
jgi:TRAP-type C4-dicarboxylate transport system substrate-binding protein